MGDLKCPLWLRKIAEFNSHNPPFWFSLKMYLKMKRLRKLYDEAVEENFGYDDDYSCMISEAKRPLEHWIEKNASEYWTDYDQYEEDRKADLRMNRRLKRIYK